MNNLKEIITNKEMSKERIKEIMKNPKTLMILGTVGVLTIGVTAFAVYKVTVNK